MLRKGDRLRVQGVGTPPPDDTERALLSGATPSGFPKRTRDATHGSLALKAYQQNLYLEYYY